MAGVLKICNCIRKYTFVKENTYFEHDLSHLFAVGFWVQRGFCEENRVFLRSNTEFVVEGVMLNQIFGIRIFEPILYVIFLHKPKLQRNTGGTT